MYVRCNPNKSNVKYLSYVRGFRDKFGNVKQVTVEKIGDWDDLIKLYDDPIAHFNSIAKQREIQLGLTNDDTLSFSVSNNLTLPLNFSSFNLGYLFFKSIYSHLNISPAFSNIQSSLNIKYSLHDIFFLLVISRIMFPSSKLDTFNNKHIFFENFNFSLKDLYRSLDHFSSLKDDILSSIWLATKNTYNRDTSLSYYDSTNYYFEISYNDEDLVDEFGNILEKGFRKKGPSKEHRKSPIVGMGLLMDNSGIPLSYDLYPGNESEKTQLRPTLKNMKSKFNINKTIVVADRALNTSDNTFFLSGFNDTQDNNMDGYVYGQSILSASKEFQHWALDDSGFIVDYINDNKNKKTTLDNDGNILDYDIPQVIFKHKSRVVSKQITIKKGNKRSHKVNIYQKQMVYYSQKYADKQKAEREATLNKAKDLIKYPGRYTKATSYGATKYIDNIAFDKSGEIIVDEERQLLINIDRVKDEEKFDGYYSIVTSEIELSDYEIKKIYGRLWKIEETFKISKSTLESRPVYVWTKEHIEAHFLTCFVALVIVRIMEKKIAVSGDESENKAPSINKIIKSLTKLNCAHIKGDIYTVLHRDEVIQYVEDKFGMDFNKKYMKLSSIKKITT